jgi:dTDP-4-dehydrorhamnose reductase
MKILLTGAGGLFGARLAEAAPDDCIVYRHYHHAPGDSESADIFVGDLTDPNHVRSLAASVDPDIIINSAALADVDRCETEPDLSHEINVVLVQNLIDAFRRSKMIQISTDYVFSDDAARGDALPTPDDPPHPVNSYGRHKLEAERIVMAASPHHLVVRVNSLYDHRGRINIFSHVYESLLSGRTVPGYTDQISNPIAAPSAAEITMDLILKSAEGTFHVGGRDIVSRYDFACKIADTFGVDKKLVVSSSSAERARPARRPIRAGLDCRLTEAFLGAPMPTMLDDLARLKREMQLA